MISNEVRRYLHELAVWGVARWRAEGWQDGDADRLRRQVNKGAARAAQKLRDPWDQETLVAEAQRALEEALKENSKR